MLSEVDEGRPVPEVAARYNVNPEYVERLVEDATAGQREPWYSPHIRGNRVVLAILIGWLAWLVTGRVSAWVFVLAGVIAYVITTAIASRLR